MESNCGCDDERMLEGGGMSVVVGLLACVGLGSLDGSPTLMGTSMEVSSGIARCCWGPGSSSPMGAGSESPRSVVCSGPTEAPSPGEP